MRDAVEEKKQESYVEKYRLLRRKPSSFHRN